MRSIFITFLFSLLFSSMFSQSFPEVTFEVLVNSEKLAHPFSGGMDTPQFSEVDLNNDGLLDLYVFDFTGKISSTYINTGSTYRYEPEYAKQFPQIDFFVLLRDFNGDGIMDIFSHAGTSNGVKVYKGFFQSNMLNFELLRLTGNLDGHLSYFDTNGSTKKIEIFETIYPAIDDLDRDGDLDIVSISEGYFQYYQNQSVENGWGKDSLVFKLQSSCYGGAFEDGGSLNLLLASLPGNCAPMFAPPENSELIHNGYSILTYDNDGDGDKDLLFGDRSFFNMNLLENIEENDQAYFGKQDTLFPHYDKPIISSVLPVSFFLDVDFDGEKDLIISSRISQINEDSYSSFYKNIGTTDAPVFSFQEEDWLTNESIDFGKIAHPTFTDFNQDGLPDLVVGTQTVRINKNITDSGLVLFENTGSLTKPVFTLVDLDWLGLSAYNSYWKRPSFGDLDGDGDEDLLIGEDSGKLLYLENIAESGQPFLFADPIYDYMEIDVVVSIGTTASPQIVDINEDGLSDIIIGTRSGNIVYFENIGTIGNPFFDPDPFTPNNNFQLGQVRIPNLGNPVPMVVEVANEKRLFVGTLGGTIWEYRDIENNLNDTFLLANDYFGEINVGDFSSPALIDIDRNGFLDMFVGNFRGGINAFATDIYVGNEIVKTNTIVKNSLKIYPNPATDRIFLEGIENTENLELYNILGHYLPLQKINLTTLDISNIPAGTYFLKIQTKDSWKVEKFVKP